MHFRSVGLRVNVVGSQENESEDEGTADHRFPTFPLFFATEVDAAFDLRLSRLRSLSIAACSAGSVIGTIRNF